MCNCLTCNVHVLYVTRNRRRAFKKWDPWSRFLYYLIRLSPFISMQRETLSDSVVKRERFKCAKNADNYPMGAMIYFDEMSATMTFILFSIRKFIFPLFPVPFDYICCFCLHFYYLMLLLCLCAHQIEQPSNGQRPFDCVKAINNANQTKKRRKKCRKTGNEKE